MENNGGGAFLRIRRLGFLNTSSSQKVGETPKFSIKDESEQWLRIDVQAYDDGWVSMIISWSRIMTCFVSMMVTRFLWALIMIVLMSRPYERIRQGRIYYWNFYVPLMYLRLDQSIYNLHRQTILQTSENCLIFTQLTYQVNED